MNESHAQLPAQSSSLERVRYIEAALGSKPLRGLSVLDIGCGNGFVCNEVSRLGAQVVGIDAVPLSPHTWNFVQVDLDDDGWWRNIAMNQRFDLVLAFDVIEHVSSPWRLLSGVKEILRPDGKVILSTPNISSWERFKSPREWSGASDPQHKHLFNSYSLSFLLERVGFTVERMDAPIRTLGVLNDWLPCLGGQLQAAASFACRSLS